jgi:hypothetical protein
MRGELTTSALELSPQQREPTMEISSIRAVFMILENGLVLSLLLSIKF